MSDGMGVSMFGNALSLRGRLRRPVAVSLPASRGLPFPSGPRSEGRSAERRSLRSTPCGVVRVLAKDTRAFRRSACGTFTSPGHAFPGIRAHDQPAPGGRTVVSSRWSPGTPQSKVTSLARRSRIPTPLAQRLMKTPSVDGIEE
jgi:hypothetical protein